LSDFDNLATLFFYQQLVGIGALGVALWQLIYTQNFVLLIGIKMRNVYVGYAVLGGFMVVCAILGICASLTRSTHGLLSYAVLMFASLICQCGVWAFTYLERNQVSANLLDNLQRYTVPHNLYQGFLQQEVGSRKVDPYRGSQGWSQGLYCHRPCLEVVCASSTKESSLASSPAPNLRYESCFYTCSYNNCMWEI